MTKKKPMDVFPLRLSDEDVARLERLSSRLPLSRSALARHALRLGLEALERATKGKRRIDAILGELAHDDE